jgi:hypothetical protein
MEWRLVDRLGFALVCCFLAALCVLVVGERMENKSKTTRLVGFTFIFYQILKRNCMMMMDR